MSWMPSGRLKAFDSQRIFFSIEKIQKQFSQRRTAFVQVGGLFEGCINESKVERYFADKITATLNGEKEDEFYLKVKELLLAEGEVSDAIGRLTDVDYYATLSYEEKQRYNLSLSEKYLRALERFRHESQFAVLKTIEK